MRIWTRILWMVVVCLPAFSQNPLADLEQSASQAYTDWYKLAVDLDVRLARMLPCDAGVNTAIEETTQAAMKRSAAMAAYTKALADEAAKDVTLARQIQRSETSYLTSVGTESNDTQQERAAIEEKVRKLSESVRKKVSLTAALDALRAVENLVRDRANLVTSNASTLEGALRQFDALINALAAREQVIRGQLTLLEDERTKWNGYYNARMARARTECQVTGR